MVADKKLEEDPWKRFEAPDASLGEKAVAWLTTTGMKAKRKIGAGLNRFALNLDNDDKAAIVAAASWNEPVRSKNKFISNERFDNQRDLATVNTIPSQKNKKNSNGR